MYITRAQAKPGDVLAVVASHGAMMVQGATPSQAEWLWEAIRSGSSFQQLVEALGFGVRPSRQIPAFAIAVSEGGHLRVALRGAFRACDRDGNVLGTGMETPTWNEAFIDRMTDLVLDAGAGAGMGLAEGLPFADGIAATSALLLAFSPGAPELRGAAAHSEVKQEAVETPPVPSSAAVPQVPAAVPQVPAPPAVVAPAGAAPTPVSPVEESTEDSIEALENTRLPLDEPILEEVGEEESSSAESADETPSDAPFFIDSVPGDFHALQDEESSEPAPPEPQEEAVATPVAGQAGAAQSAAVAQTPEEEPIPQEELEEIAANLPSADSAAQAQEQPRFPVESRFPIDDHAVDVAPAENAEVPESPEPAEIEEPPKPEEIVQPRKLRPWEVAAEEETPVEEESPSPGEEETPADEAFAETASPVESPAGPEEEEADVPDPTPRRPFDGVFPPVASAQQGPAPVAENHDVQAAVVEQEARVEAESPQAMVLAVLCQNGHLNPPHGKVCRICSGPLGGEPNWYPRPSLGEIWVSTGLNVPLDADIIIGRKPASAPEPGRPRAHLVPVPSPDQQISRTHCEIRVDNWDVRLIDRNSNNGTYVLRPNERPIRISPAEPFFLRVSDVIDIGEGVTIQMLGPRSGA